MVVVESFVMEKVHGRYDLLPPTYREIQDASAPSGEDGVRVGIVRENVVPRPANERLTGAKDGTQSRRLRDGLVPSDRISVAHIAECPRDRAASFVDCQDCQKLPANEAVHRAVKRLQGGARLFDACVSRRNTRQFRE
jgi:hypothetical protein